ncbi:hypothetical protein HZA76_04450 [Candidatus Roizmanbacteria bacterium]|nr:hypothetical protein [Candidatus Roizmanbacteria bacterium]
MSIENKTINNKEFPSGWFKCNRCGYFILLKGDDFNKARGLKQNKLPIICDTCNPKNGLKPGIRRQDQFINLPGEPDVG